MKDIHELQRVNKLVNQSVLYAYDKQQYGVPEYWVVAGKYGDCEDYAIRKLRVLAELGWPIEDLRLCVCWVGRKAPDTGHCILVVHIDNELYGLDNRFNAVYKIKNRDEYIFASCQIVGGEQQWGDCSKVFPRIAEGY